MKNILSFLTFVWLLSSLQNTHASFEDSIKQTYSYKNSEFNFITNFSYNNKNSSPKINQIEYSKKFINLNLSENHNKNFITYSIIAESFINSNLDLTNQDFDISYIREYRKLFDIVSFREQCESSFVSSSIFLNYGILISERDFKENFLEGCSKYISDYEVGFALLQFIGSRSYVDVPIDDSFKNIALNLTTLNPYIRMNDRPYIIENKSELNWDTLFKFKGYAALSTYYENKRNYEDWVINSEKAKLFTNVSEKNWIFNASLSGEVEYWIMNFKKTRTTSLDEKILLFKNFEEAIDTIFSKDIEKKYTSVIYYLDAYIGYITDLFKKNQDKDQFTMSLKFAESKAKKNINSEYLLSFIDGQKKTYLSDQSTTEGIVNQKNPLMPNSSSYEKFSQKVESAYNEERYKDVIKIINEYEIKNGILSMITNPHMTFLKYASYDYLDMHKEAIQYNYELIRNFANETFFSSSLNYLDSSQSSINKKKINEISTLMIESLFRFQYGNGYDGDKEGDERYSDQYRDFLPMATNMILYAAQISDLNEANHSNKYLSLKNTIKTGLKLTNQKENLSENTNNILKNFYNNEKKFIQHSNNFPNDLETLSVLKDQISQSKNDLENSKEIQIIKKRFPEVFKARKPPLVLTQLLGKINLNEKIIYVKDFGEILYVFSISHSGFDWLYVQQEKMDEFKKDILKYKQIISNPKTPFDKKLSKKIFSNFLWTSINVDDMQYTNKIYFINSSNLIDLPLETLIFIEGNNEYPDTYLIDYFNFVYLPSIQFFEEITSSKTIAGQMGFEIDAKIIDDNLLGFEFLWIEGDEDTLIFDTFKSNDVITKFNNEIITYGTLIGFFHAPSNCRTGMDDWCNFDISFIRDNKEFTKSISVENFFYDDFKNDFIGFGNPLFGINKSHKNVDLALKKLRYTDDMQVDNLDEFFKLLPPLPETEFEISYPAKLLEPNKTRTFLGKNASEKNFKSLGNDSTRILSIASHAVSIGNNELIKEPSLILSNVKTDDEDGILTASEIFELNIKNDLVILSACNTFSNLSDSIHKISGLANSFILAGSNNLILSRWPVDSDATTHLMTKFYRYIIYQNEDSFSNDYSGALRWAMLETKLIEEHPFYWSPFLVIGQ